MQGRVARLRLQAALPSSLASPAHPTPPHPQHLNVGGCSDGYSTSRTCEMSLSNHSGINFRGLVRPAVPRGVQCCDKHCVEAGRRGSVGECLVRGSAWACRALWVSPACERRRLSDATQLTTRTAL